MQMSKTIKIESPQIAVDITLKPLMSDEDVVANDLFIRRILAAGVRGLGVSPNSPQLNKYKVYVKYFICTCSPTAEAIVLETI